MRISTKQYYDIAEQSLTSSANGAYSWQRKLASGLRFDRASEDPAAAGRAVILSARLSRIDMFKGNQGFAQANLADLDTALDGIQTQVDILQEVSTQAGNGTLSSVGFSALKARADQAIQELSKVAQQKDSSGRPLFDNDEAAQLDVQDGVSVNILLTRSQVYGSGEDLANSDMMKAVSSISTALSENRAPTVAEVGALQTARDQLTKARTGVGLDSNTADNASDAVGAYELGVLQQKSELMDTDIAQGVSEFARNQTLLETARSLFARINSTGLFGLLK